MSELRDDFRGTIDAIGLSGAIEWANTLEPVFNRFIELESEPTTLKTENERFESLVDAEIQEIGKLRVERNALQASIDDAPTWTIKNGKLDNWNSLTSLDFHNKTVTVALVQKSEHTAEPLGECTDNI